VPGKVVEVLLLTNDARVRVGTPVLPGNKPIGYASGGMVEGVRTTVTGFWGGPAARFVTWLRPGLVPG
jgi:hypothetical protein